MARKEKAEEITVEELLNEMRGELVYLNRMAAKAPISMLIEAATSGQEFQALKTFRDGDNRYMPGDIVKVDTDGQEWLFTHGFVTTVDKARKSAKSTQLQKFYRDEVARREMRYQNAAQNERRADEAVRNAEAKLDAARDALIASQAQKAADESGLKAALERMKVIRDTD